MPGLWPEFSIFYQHNLPLVPTPLARIASALGYPFVEITVNLPSLYIQASDADFVPYIYFLVRLHEPQQIFLALRAYYCQENETITKLNEHHLEPLKLIPLASIHKCKTIWFETLEELPKPLY
jgi:hypothetical protein